MATSGTTFTNTYNTASFYCSWERTNYSSAENYSDIKWTAGLYISGNYHWGSNAIRINSVTINGSVVMGSTTVSNKYGPGWFEMSNGTARIYHNNDGTKSFGISISGWLYSNHDLSGESTFTLDTLPRYANFTEHYVESSTVNSITVHWNADAYIDAVQYSLNDGAWTDTAGLTYTIGGLNYNTYYNIRTRIKRNDSQLWTESGYIGGTTKDIGRVTGANNFNSNENPYMTFTNSGGLVIDASLEFGGTYIIRYNIPNTGNYTFQLTQAEKDLLYSKCSNSKTLAVRYVIQSNLNGTPTWWSWADRTMTVVNSNPIFSDFNYEDIKTESIELTGNNQVLINGYNTLQVTIPVAYKAIAQNSATMSKYRLVCGNNNIEANYSSDSDVTLLLQNVVNMQFSVYAIDSRGYSTTVSKSALKWINYTNPIISGATATRENNIDTDTVLSFTGRFWATEEEHDFGDEENEIVSCYYQYKKTNEDTYSQPIAITPTVSSSLPGYFSFQDNIIGDEGANGFNLLNSYDIHITLEDKITTTSYDVLLGVGNPLMSIAPEGVAFGLPYNDAIGGALQIEERKGAAFELTDFLTTPLTNSNLFLTDNDISKARLVIVYYTLIYSGVKYRGSIVIPTNDNEWYMVNHNGLIGYIKVIKNNNQLITSQYSDNEFAVLGYTLIM